MVICDWERVCNDLDLNSRLLFAIPSKYIDLTLFFNELSEIALADINSLESSSIWEWLRRREYLCSSLEL